MLSSSNSALTIATQTTRLTLNREGATLVML
ncbi:hypothetical protein DEFR109230_07420 [Deinococcus frigens]